MWSFYTSIIVKKDLELKYLPPLHDLEEAETDKGQNDDKMIFSWNIAHCRFHPNTFLVDLNYGIDA